LLFAGIILAFGSEILRWFFLLPYAFSQNNHAAPLAYFFYEHIIWLRIAALLLILLPAWHIMRYTATFNKIALVVCCIAWGVVALCCSFYLNIAEKYEPIQTKKFSIKAGNKISTDKQVLGIFINGESKAYPIRMLA